MVSGANVCDELQGLDLNFPALILSRLFCVVFSPVALKVFGAVFCLLPISSGFFPGFSRLCHGINGRRIQCISNSADF